MKEKLSEKYWEKYQIVFSKGTSRSMLGIEHKEKYDMLVSLEAKILTLRYLHERCAASKELYYAIDEVLRIEISEYTQLGKELGL